MIIYNTTFHMDRDVVEECLVFLKSTYIPAAASSGFLLKPRLCSIITGDEEEGKSYSLQFHVKNTDTLHYWMEQEGCKLQDKLVNRFGAKVTGFSTLLEEIDL